MDPVIDRILAHLESEWHVIKRAPFAFVIIMGAGFGAGWWVASTHYEGTIQNFNAALVAAGKDKELAENELKRSKEGGSGDIPSQIARFLREKAAPYSIPKEDEETVVQALKATGKYTVEIHCDEDGTAPFVFADALRKLMARAGWSVEEAITGFSQLDPGVTILTDEKNVSAGVFQLMKLLEKYHVDVYLSRGNKEGATEKFAVLVGKRPQF